MAYLILLGAITSEVAATSALKLSNGFTRPVPTMLAFALYVLAFYFLSLALKHMPVGTAYAIWSGLGTLLISFVGFVAFRQLLDAAAVIGVGLILCGVLVITLLSRIGIQ